jgi:transcriptional regulator with XRE-family HTH domain
LNKLLSIKEARLAKGLTINQLAKKLKLSEEIIQKIENNEELPNKFRSYEKIFRNSILKSLGLYENSTVVELAPIPKDNTKLILTIFFFILIIIILFSLSFDMYKKFNFKSDFNLIEKDQIYLDAVKILSNFNYEEINHDQFINKLVLNNNNNIHNSFELSVFDNYSISYKIIDNIQKTINFGTITSDNPLKLDFNGDFSIDLSNIQFIDKIITNNFIYHINVNKSYALKEFNISKLSEIK